MEGWPAEAGCQAPAQTMGSGRSERVTPMSAQPHALTATRPGARGSWSTVSWVGFGGVALIGLVTAYLGTHPRSSAANQRLGDLAVLLAALFATTACARAARQRTATARAWLLLALSMGLWSVGQLTYTYFGLTRDHVYRSRRRPMWPSWPTRSSPLRHCSPSQGLARVRYASCSTRW